MRPGDRLVCSFVEPVQTGQTFAKWLLHVTIVPWFRSDASSDDIANGLARAYAAIEPFEAVAGEETRFGPRKNRPATLLELPSSFTELEQRTRNYLHKKRALLIDETTKKRRQYRPHVTHQNDAALQAGDTFRCDRVYMVQQHGGHKEIVSEIELIR